jgi:hypothetical protein
MKRCQGREQRATAWMAEARFPAVARYFSLLHSVQTGSGTKAASYPMGPGGYLLGSKQPGHEADHSPPLHHMSL